MKAKDCMIYDGAYCMGWDNENYTFAVIKRDNRYYIGQGLDFSPRFDDQIENWSGQEHYQFMAFAHELSQILHPYSGGQTCPIYSVASCLGCGDLIDISDMLDDIKFNLKNDGVKKVVRRCIMQYLKAYQYYYKNSLCSEDS